MPTSQRTDAQIAALDRVRKTQADYKEAKRLQERAFHERAQAIYDACAAGDGKNLTMQHVGSAAGINRESVRLIRDAVESGRSGAAKLRELASKARRRSA